MKTSVLLPVMITEPRQLIMTEFAIQALELTAEDFELVIVETGENHSDFWLRALSLHNLKYIHCPVKSSYTKDANLGLRQCEGEFVVHTGNDVFVRQGWLEALHEPFEKFVDCGVSCLASTDLPDPLNKQGDFIVEGVYGPHMMFRREVEEKKFPAVNYHSGGVPTHPSTILFDTDFPDIFSDTDLILAHYAAGFRSYRNHRVVIDHLNKATYNDLHTEEEQRERHIKYGTQMGEKHMAGCSHLRMFHHLIDGHVV